MNIHVPLVLLAHVDMHAEYYVPMRHALPTDQLILPIFELAIAFYEDLWSISRDMEAQ